MTTGNLPQRLPVGKRRRLAILPTTRLGRRAVWLAAANVVLMLTWMPTRPVGAPLGLVCGFVGGILALVAIFRRGERAVAVFAAVLPLLMVVSFVLAELLIGHD